MATTFPASPSTLVLGAGELGLPMLRALARQKGGDLAVLLRRSSESTEAKRSQLAELASLGVRVAEGDLARVSTHELSAIFRSFDTVIGCAGFVGGEGTQRKITQAVLDAGVARYVPWQFGVDYDLIGRGSGQAVWDEQLDVRDMLRTQSATEWVIVSTGMFTSFLFEPAFGVVDLASRRVRALGDWRRKVTVTTPEDIGSLTAAILAATPRIVNEVVHVAGDTLSYADLARIVEEVTGHPVQRDAWQPDALARDLSLAPDDVMARYRFAFATDIGVAWKVVDTFNGRRGIPVTDVRQWLTHRLGA